MSISENINIDDKQSELLGSLAMPSDYFALLKPRVMSLVVFTALVGLMVAPGEIHPAIAVIAILCIAIGAGASGALNMWYDADIDAVMTRTANRPIPAGIIAPGAALGIRSVPICHVRHDYGRDGKLVVSLYSGVHHFLLCYRLFPLAQTLHAS